MTPRMVMFHVPEDSDLLAALGEVTLRHEHLNHILKMPIKSLANLTPQEAVDATAFQGPRVLRQRINKLARKKLGEGEALLKLQALVTRTQRLTEQRNNLIHGLWAKELDGEPGLYAAEGELKPIPAITDLQQLSASLSSLMKELNEARLDGFLKQALEEAGSVA